jgi:ApbE superfamily uncharacterized protein (UPF0280 family)
MMAQRLHGDRLHLQNGPIDVVLRAWGDPRDVAAAEHAAAARFATILDDLVAELPVLRCPVGDGITLHGPVARRMLGACLPFARRGAWLTSMAAVAGAVADEVMAAMRAAAPALRKAFVNDGGDIAVFVAPGEALTLGMASDAAPVARPTFDGTLTLTAESAIRGVATSGRHGRSFSLGIADAVTVLATDAATADAAATLIANAVNLDSPAVTRAPAVSLDPDSDLGDRLVTTEVGALTPTETARALDAGLAVAEGFIHAGLIRAAALRLRGEARVTGTPLLQDHAA